MKVKYFLVPLFCIFTINAFCQNELKNENLNIKVNDWGIVTSFTYNGARGKTDVSFRSDDAFKGPALFFSEKRIDVKKVDGGSNELMFAGETDSLKIWLKYKIEDGAFVVESSVTNKLNSPIKNPILTLRPGVNTELDSFPKWNNIFFPTLLRCEPTHFWGYNMNASGDIIAMGTKEPVASWQMEYVNPLKKNSRGGHLIFSYRLDLMHKLPLPARHPQNLTELKANEQKTWTFYIKPTSDIQSIKPILSNAIQAPMITSDSYTALQGEAVDIQIITPTIATATITNPNGVEKNISLGKKQNGKYQIKHFLKEGAGIYTLKVKDKNNKIAEAIFSARQHFSWYMDKAREASVKYQQYPSTHLENWLGLHSGLLARKYSKDALLDKAIEERLNTILNLQWDKETHIPKLMYEHRKLANSAQMISVLVDAYEATKNIYYLEKARGLATILMTFQFENGDYAKYSAIFYPVKSMMELIIAEKDFLSDPTWKMYYEKHMLSVKKAIDFLVEKKDDILTEGEQTLEDGMISCSATQIAMFALMQKDSILRKHYTDIAILMDNKHKLLEQSIIPDARMNGGTIRFWEAQYDALETKKRNFINSPHGWSAWRIYGVCYLYQLTGDEKYLKDLINAVGASVQVIEPLTGKLRWSFVPDPYCEVKLLRPNPATPGKGEYYETVVGEQYIDMISDFQHHPSDTVILKNYPRVNGWTCNNDVHEIFKSMEEVCLSSAYVLEKADGSFVTWNCKLVVKNGTLEITPVEKTISGVHLNLKSNQLIKVNLASGEINHRYLGMGWIGKSPIPLYFYTP